MTSAPDYIEPLIGYRAWVARSDAGLYSFSDVSNKPWRVGTTTATCRRRGRRGASATSHVVPGEQCTCGLYALTDLDDRQLRGLFPFKWSMFTPVVGAIAAWGDVEAHATGFRAQYACVLALAVHERMTRDQHQLAEGAAALYGVPLLPMKNLREEAIRHGAPLPPPWRRAPSRPATRSPGTVPRAHGRRGERSLRTGFAVDQHLWIAQRDGVCLLGLTAEAGTRLVPPLHQLRLPSVGNAFARGETLATVETGECPAAVSTPLSGRVAAVNTELLRDPDLLRSDPETEGWLARLVPSKLVDEAQDIAWGPAGHLEYTAYAGERGDDLVEDLRPGASRDDAPVAGWADVKRAVLAAKKPHFAAASHFYASIAWRLQQQLAEDRVLGAELAQLEVSAFFRLHEPNASLTLRLGGGEARVEYGRASDCDLVLNMSGNLAAEYFTGEFDWVAAVDRGELTIEGDTGRASEVAAAVSRLSHFASRRG